MLGLELGQSVDPAVDVPILVRGTGLAKSYNLRNHDARGVRNPRIKMRPPGYKSRARISGLCLAFIATVLAGQGCGNGTEKCSPRDATDGCGTRNPTAADCLAADGCSVGQNCSEVSCTSFETMSACSAVPTCRWLSGSCAFAPGNPCDQLAQQACMAQAGCTWAAACVGRMKSCAGLGTNECAAIPHCYTETVPDF